MDKQAGNEEYIQIVDGRQYYDNEKIAYVLPHDIDECGRLEKQHHIFKFLFQKNFSAPVRSQLEEGITVLDSGCGPGSWTIDMANDFPNSKFHGVDISNFFPDTKPDNCEFTIGNLTETLPYEDNTFDYIHQRLLVFGLTKESWDLALKELFRVLKPGGYIEIIEANVKDARNTGPLLDQLHGVMNEMLVSRNIFPDIAVEMKERVTNTGFVNVEETLGDLPLNHSGRGGELIWGDYYHVYMNIRSMMATTNPEWEELEAYQLHLQKCAEEAASLKTTFNWHTVCAQKALDN